MLPQLALEAFFTNVGSAITSIDLRPFDERTSEEILLKVRLGWVVESVA